MHCEKDYTILAFFHYDSNGNVTAMSRFGKKYYFVKNLQGDIERIVDSDGTTVVTYTYDVLGNIIAQTDTSDINLANINPFCYRGYVYDSETGLYYLKSRYYDPVTGRFLNADMYCDTQSNILGTNMFAYCNNNPVNQIDPEGTDAIWLQFAYGANGFGHTSLLIQDSANIWWYFYWGPKHAILRPCGKDDFTIQELNSYLTGFDPRKGHNYYVYATNVFDPREDANYKFGSNYYLKCNDGTVSNTLTFYGKFGASYEYAKKLLIKLYSNSNANQLYETIYENGKKQTMLHVCFKERNNSNVVANPDEAFRDFPLGYYYSDIVGNGKGGNYSLLSYNCVQVSMEVLLQGNFSSNSQKYKNEIRQIYNNPIRINMYPNSVFVRLLNLL